MVIIDERMTAVNLISAVGSITKMPEHHFSDKTYIFAHPFCVFYKRRVHPGELINILMYFLKNLSNSLRRIRPVTAHKTLPLMGIQLNRTHSCSILPTVVLLFHQQVQFI